MPPTARQGDAAGKGAKRFRCLTPPNSKAATPDPSNAKRRFCCQPPKRVASKTPCVADCTVGTFQPTNPPDAVKHKLTNAALIIGVDVETHSWLDGGGPKKGRIGNHGFYALIDERNLEFARIVQLGWVIGCSDEGQQAHVAKERLVKPDGFEIAPRASAYHGITHQRAMEEGQALRGVLEEFLGDVAAAVERGGRVVAHHLEFDAGVISTELERCGLGSLRREWGRFVRTGFCTMDPDVGRWVRSCNGKDPGPSTAKNSTSLKEMVRWLVPRADALLAKHHSAQADAMMHRLVYINLLRLQREARESAVVHT